MAADPRDTPLFVLDAVAIDVETTGLDPMTARIIEIGAVEIGPRKGKVATFSTFVDAGAIPTRATEITGITQAMTSGAPAFSDAFRRMLDHVGGRVVVGHAFGFDLAVFREECRRAGLSVWTPSALDTRILAQIVFPALPAYSLEIVAARCGAKTGERHRALGDAESSGAVFAALVPLLRERGIRTLGEAVAAMRRYERAASYPSVWATLAEGTADVVPSRADVDGFLYDRRVDDIMGRSPRFIPQTRSLEEAARTMAEARIGSLFVGGSDAPASELAVITERDVLKAVAADGASALGRPVVDFASAPLIGIASGDFPYRAAGRMNRLGIRHLAVLDESDRVVGVLSARDLLRSRMTGPVALGDAIDVAADVEMLGKAWSAIPAVVRGLEADGMDGRKVAAVLAGEVAALTKRAAELAEGEMFERGEGSPPCRYCVTVMGSAGRGESLLAFDQDNAIIFERGEAGGAEDGWFARLAERFCAILHEVGVPFCPGGVMATNPLWRGDLALWRERARHWLERSSPEDLLAADIALDMRVVHGDRILGETFRRETCRAARDAVPFLKLLAEAGAEQEAPFGFFGGLKTREGVLDLKRVGLKPLITGARVLALRAGVAALSTAGRLAGVRAAGQGHATDLEALDHAHELFLTLILRRQLRDIAAGKPPRNLVMPDELDRRSLDALKKGLGTVTMIPELVRDRLSD